MKKLLLLTAIVFSMVLFAFNASAKNQVSKIGLENAMENDITLIEWPEIAKDVLPENTIHIFISEYNNIPYRFDFAVFENQKLIYLIEFDGEYHFHY